MKMLMENWNKFLKEGTAGVLNEYDDWIMPGRKSRVEPMERNPEIVAEQIILQYIVGRNAQVKLENILSQLSQPAASEYIEKFATTYEKVLPHLKNAVDRMQKDFRDPNYGSFQVLRRDHNLDPEGAPHNMFVVTLDEEGYLKVDVKSA